MKKQVGIFAIMFAMIAIVTLSSCSTQKPVTESLTNDIGEKIASCDSFETKITMDIKYFTDDGAAVNAYAEGREIVSGLMSGDFQMYMKLRTEVSSEKLEEKQTTTVTEGYYGGKYFLTTRGDYYKQDIYSDLTTEEARDFVIGNGVGFDIYFDCKKTSSSAQDDGSTMLFLSGYSEKTVDVICNHFGVDDSVFGAKVSDVNVCITVDESYLVKDMTQEFVFEKTEEQENVPIVKIVAEYSKFDEARIPPEMVNLTHHTEVYDIRILKKIDNMLYDLYNSSYGSFDLSICQTEKLMGQEETKKESQRIFYGNDENGYFFNIEDDFREQITKYKNGNQSTEDLQGMQLSSETKSEFEAKKYISSLINTAGFNISSVTDIKKISNGVYELSCSNKVPYKQVYQGWTTKGVEQILTITVVDDKIVKIESQMKITGEYASYPHYFKGSITIDSTVDFQK